jgi:hypothetical protein
MTQGALLTVACHPPSKRAAVKESPHPSSRLDRTVALSVSTVDQAAGGGRLNQPRCRPSQSASIPEGPPQSSSAGATARTGEGRRCRKGARRRKAALLIEEVLPSYHVGTTTRPESALAPIDGSDAVEAAALHTRQRGLVRK